MDTKLHTSPTGPLQRLLQHTIWNRNLLLLEVPERFAPIFTVLLPLAYGLLTLFGLFGANAPPTGVLAAATTAAYSVAWSTAVSVVAPVCFIAEAGRLPRLELVSVLVLTIVLAVYPAALAFEGFGANDYRSVATAAALTLLPLIVATRAIDLVRVARRTDV